MTVKIDGNRTVCFCFDRDSTVDVGIAPGAVPLEWVRYLDEETNHQVWATGNQLLKEEAEIPGIKEALDILREESPNDDDSYFWLPRRKGLEYVREATSADVYVVVDDVDVSDLDGFVHYFPSKFTEEFRDDLRDIASPSKPAYSTCIDSA